SDHSPVGERRHWPRCRSPWTRWAVQVCPSPASAGGGQAPAAPAPPQTASAPAASGTPAAPAAAPMHAPPAGGPDPRVLWPNILEAVKNRRRFTWILLSQNAQVTGYDGTTLQIGFVNAGARDNFASSGSEDVLKQALAEQFNIQWKIEAIVDASGGSASPPMTAPGPGFGGGGAGGGLGGGAGYGGGGAGYGGAPAASRPAAPQSPAPGSRPAAPQGPSAGQAAPAPRPSGPPAPEPPPVAPEDDIPEDDDPDLDESALSGHDLIVRELGATVVEEFTNE
ncbi:DNA polymerase III subunit gamma and tau, partial [Streptomyces fagopyri]